MNKKGIVAVLALVALVLFVLNVKTWSLDRVHVTRERARATSEQWGKDVRAILELFNSYEKEIGDLPREGSSLGAIAEISARYSGELKELSVSGDAEGLKASMGRYFEAAGEPIAKAGELEESEPDKSQQLVHTSIKLQAAAFREFVDELKAQTGEMNELHELEALAQEMEELAAQFPSAQV